MKTLKRMIKFGTMAVLLAWLPGAAQAGFWSWLTGGSADRPGLEIEDLEIRGKIDGENVNFTLAFAAQVNRPEQALALARGDVGWLGGDLPKGVKLERPSGAYLLRFESTGKRVISFAFASRPEKNVDWRETGFAVPEATVRRLVMECDRDDLEVQFPGALNVVREKDKATGKTVVKAFLATGVPFAVRWKPEVRKLDGELVVACEANTVAVARTGAMQLDTVFLYRVVQGQLQQAELDLPAGMQVTQVRGLDIREWTIVKKDAGARTLLVVLNRPKEKFYQLQVEGEVVLPAFPAKADLPFIMPKNVIRTSGFLMLGADSAIKLLVNKAAGLTQVDQGAFPLAQMQLADGKVQARSLPARSAYAYQYANLPCQMELAADDITTGLFAEDRLVLALENNSLTLSVVTELDIRDAAARDVSIRTDPGWVVASVSGANISDYDVREKDGARVIQAFFKQAVSGRTLIEVRLERALAADAAAFDLPGYRVVGAKSERGYVVLKAEQGVRLKAEKADGLREVHTASLPTRVPGAQSAYRFKDPEWTARLAVEKAASAVHAELFHLVSLGEATLYGSCSITCNISGAPVRSFRVRVPAECQNVEFTGRDIRNWTKDGDIYTVALQEKVSGDYTLLVTYDQPLAYEGGKVAAGGIRTLDTESESGYIALAGAASLSFAGEEKGDKTVLPLNGTELPQEYKLLVNDPVLCAYKFVGQPHDVEVRVRRFATLPLLMQVADHMSLSTRLSEAGEAVTSATYFVKNTAEQYFRVKLPAGARLWSVEVDGSKIQELDNGQGAVLIPVERRRDPNQALVVCLTYAEQQTKMGWRQRVAFQAPGTGTRSVFARWQFTAPEKYRLEAVGGNMLPQNVPPRSFARLGSELCQAWRNFLRSGLGWMSLAVVLGLTLLAVRLNAARGAACHWTTVVAAIVGIVAVAYILINLSFAFWNQGGVMPCEMQQQRAVACPQVSPLGLQSSVEMTKPVTLADSELQAVLVVMPDWLLLTRAWARLAAGLVMGALAVWLFRRRLLADVPGAGPAVALTLVVWGVCAFPAAMPATACVLLLLPLAAFTAFLAVLGGKLGARMPRPPAPNDENGHDQGADDETEPAPASNVPSTGAAVLLAAGLLWLGGAATSPCQAAGMKSGRTDLASSAPAPALPVMQTMTLTVAAPDVNRDPTQVKNATVDMELTFETKEAGGRFRILPPTYVLTRHVADPDRLELTAAADGYWLAVRRSGKQTLKLTFLAPVSLLREGGCWSLPLWLPPALQNQAAFTVPGIGWEVLSDQAVSLKSEEKDGKTEGRLVAGPADTLQLRWQPRARKTQLEKAVVYAEVNTLALFQPGLVGLTHRIRYQIAQGELQSLGMQVPAGVNVTAVTGVGVGTWRFDPETRMLEALLEKPVAGEYELTVATQIPRESLPYTAELQLPAVQGVARQRGTLAMAAVESVQIRADTLNGLSGMNSGDFAAAAFANVLQCPGQRSPTTLPLPEIKRSFRYQQLPATAMVAAEKVLPEIRVAETSQADVSDERIRLSSSLEVTVAKAGIFSVRLDIPESYDIESLTGQDVSHWDEVKEDGHGVIVHFTRQVTGTRTLNLVLSRMEKGLPPLLEMPRVAVRDVFKQGGTLVLSGERGVRFTAAKREGVSELNPRDLGIQQAGYLAFRLLRPDWAVTLKTEAVEPVVKADVLQRVDVSEGMLSGRCQVLYSIEHAGVKLFRLQAPAPGVALTITGRNIARIQQADREKGIWEVELAAKQEKEYRLEAAWQQPFDPKASQAQVLPLRTLGTEAQKGYFVVFAGGRLQVKAATVPAGMTAEDSRSLPPRFGGGDLSGAVLCYRTTSADQALDLSVVRHATAAVEKGRINRLRLTSVVGSDNQLLTRAELDLVELNALRFLEVSLPKGKELWSVFVNGKAAMPLKEKDRFLIPLEGAGLGPKARVDFLYSGASGTAVEPFAGRLWYEGPMFNLPMVDLQWDFFLPPDFRYHGVDGTMRLREGAGGEVSVFTVSQYSQANKGVAASNLKQAEEVLELGNNFSINGQQMEARAAMQSAIALSQGKQALNEDARIQFRKLVTQQAVVGLVNRRNTLKANRNIANEAELSQLRGFNNGNFDLNYQRQLSQNLNDDDNGSLNKMAEKILDQQTAAEVEVNPIQITLPVQGRHLVFFRESQIQPDSATLVSFKVGAPWFRGMLAPAAVAAGLAAGFWLCWLLAAGCCRAGRED